MITKSYTMSITATNPDECAKAMQAATKIVSKLSTKDLVTLADIIEKNPGVVETAKQFMGLN